MAKKITKQDYADAKVFSKLFGVGILGVIIVMIVYISIMYCLDWDMAKRGQFGDMFAVINTFFSGLGFFLLFYTLVVQMIQLRSQQIQINKAQKEQQEQNENLKKQHFESAFFNLLQLQNELVKNIDIKKFVVSNEAQRMVFNNNKKETIYGKDCFKFFFNSLKKRFDELKPIKILSNDLVDINKVYIKFHAQYQNDLSHYFTTLYHLIKFVHQSDVPDKKRYTSLIRAQLSSHELLLLFYNCLSDLGNEKFKPLVIEYSLLKNTPFSELIYHMHKSLYDKSAYGELSD